MCHNSRSYHTVVNLAKAQDEQDNKDRQVGDPSAGHNLRKQFTELRGEKKELHRGEKYYFGLFLCVTLIYLCATL